MPCWRRRGWIGVLRRGRWTTRGVCGSRVGVHRGGVFVVQPAGQRPGLSLRRGLVTGRTVGLLRRALMGCCGVVGWDVAGLVGAGWGRTLADGLDRGAVGDRCGLGPVVWIGGGWLVVVVGAWRVRPGGLVRGLWCAGRLVRGVLVVFRFRVPGED